MVFELVPCMFIYLFIFIFLENRLLWSEIDNLREVQRDQDRKIMDLEDTLESLRGSYSTLIDEIGALQVLSHQVSMNEGQPE